MLTIRSQQLEILGKVTGEGFSSRIARYLRDRFPEELAGVADGDFNNLVSRGTARAPAYGFTSEREVSRFLMLMIFLGPDFDTDPRLAHWVAPLLIDSKDRHASFRMDELFERAVDSLRRRET